MHSGPIRCQLALDLSPVSMLLATFTKSRFRDDGNCNNRKSLGNRSLRPRQYTNTLAVICATATVAVTATREAPRKSYFKDLRELLVLSYISNVVFGEGFYPSKTFFFLVQTFRITNCPSLDLDVDLSWI